jgi:hypothetical protein
VSTDHIRWYDGEEASMTACLGYVGTLNDLAFTILKPVPDAGLEWSEYVLTSRLPGQASNRHYASDVDPLKRTAEHWLTEFAASLGAVFPEPAKEAAT